MNQILNQIKTRCHENAYPLNKIPGVLFDPTLFNSFPNEIKNASALKLKRVASVINTARNGK